MFNTRNDFKIAVQRPKCNILKENFCKNECRIAETRKYQMSKNKIGRIKSAKNQR